MTIHAQLSPATGPGLAFPHDPAAAHRARLGRGRVPPARAQARRRPRSARASASSPRRAHSGTDLVAALLTFFAVALGAPADRGHHYGHGRPEPRGAGGGRLPRRRQRLDRSPGDPAARGRRRVDVDPTGGRSLRRARARDRLRAQPCPPRRAALPSDALFANALHFGSDFAGTLAVLAGLALAALGFPAGDSIAALFVSALVVSAAIRLARRNVDVLMDRSPRTTRGARQAIAGLDPPVELRRLRLRQAGGEHFADVVIGVPPAPPSARATPPPIGSRRRSHGRCPGSTSSSTSSRASDGRSASACTLRRSRCSRVREIHNLKVIEVDGRTEISLHLKLPGELSLERRTNRRAGRGAILGRPGSATRCRRTSSRWRRPPRARRSRTIRAAIERIVREETGGRRRASCASSTRTTASSPSSRSASTRAESLAAAHARASAIEERIAGASPRSRDVVVHTEP